MKTVAVIPAFNESATLRDVVAKAAMYVDVVMVVDDGSRTSLEALLPIGHNIVFLRHAINLGKGAAMKTGVEAGLRHGAEVIIFLDADGQHDPAEIPHLIQPIADDVADVVFGIRKFSRAMPFVSKLGNIFLTRVMSVLFRIYVRDTQSGFRAFRTSIYPQLCWGSPRYAVETEMIVNAGKHHLRWTEVEIRTIYLDAYRGTTIIDGIRIFINMIAWRFL